MPRQVRVVQTGDQIPACDPCFSCTAENEGAIQQLGQPGFVTCFGAAQLAPSSEEDVANMTVLFCVKSRWITPVVSSSTAVFCPML